MLRTLTKTALDFPYMSARELSVGDVPVLASRVTYVGELGWELYCPAEYGLELWDTLLVDGVTPGGYRAIDALRLEKGYRAWASDLNAETTPDEAGLGFAVKRDKGEFVGRDALDPEPASGSSASSSTIRARSHSARSRCATRTATIVGRVTSGGYGYAVGASIALRVRPRAYTEPGTAIDGRHLRRLGGGGGARGAVVRPEGRAGARVTSSSSAAASPASAAPTTSRRPA